MMLGDQVDLDGDLIVNILEYALASDPNSPSPNSWPAGTVVANQFQLHFSRNASVTDLTYAVQTTSSLNGPWTNLLTYDAAGGWVTNNPGATVSEAAPVGSPPDQSVAVTISANINPGPAAAFFRVTVQQ